MAKNKRGQKYKTFKWSQIVVLISIAATLVVVILTFVAALLNDPVEKAKADIDDLVARYYEDVYYEHMLNSDNYSGDPEKALAKYNKTGLAAVSLRQLIILNNAMGTKNANNILEYCDENSTFVRYYPEPPYARDSYRVNITYSCNF